MNKEVYHRILHLFIVKISAQWVEAHIFGGILSLIRQIKRSKVLAHSTEWLF